MKTNSNFDFFKFKLWTYKRLFKGIELQERFQFMTAFIPTNLMWKTTVGFKMPKFWLQQNIL